MVCANGHGSRQLLTHTQNPSHTQVCHTTPFVFLAHTHSPPPPPPPPHVPPPCVYITGCVSSERQLVTHQIRRICHTPISLHMPPPYATADSSHLAHLHPPPFVTRPVLPHMSHAPSFPRLHRHHSSLAVPTEHSLVAGLSALSAPFASTNLGHVAWDEANPPPDPPP